VLALLVYGPYPQALFQPLALGGVVGFFGFVGGVIWVGHPLREELGAMWLKLQRWLPG
jgi:hypothetical protein